MKIWYRNFLPLVFVASLVFFASGCIRLFAKAGYVNQKPQEHTERVVGFDTAKAFENRETKGNVTS